MAYDGLNASLNEGKQLGATQQASGCCQRIEIFG
jgi:hypothetical protein